MGKGPIIAGVVALIAVLAIGAYLLLGKSSQNPKLPGTTNSPNTTSDSAATSLQNLLALGQNQQCTVVDADTGSEVAVYVSQGNMRGDFTTVSEDRTVNGHTIIKGDDMYIWMDGETTGFKASVSASEELASQVNTGSANSAVDLSQEVDYDCSPWSVDNTKFNLPNGVTFQDFSSLMPTGVSGQGTGSTEAGADADAKAAQCGACDSLPEESAASCRQALGC